MTTNAMLRVPQVLERTGVCRASLYNWIREGKFPAPVELGGNSIGWPESEIEAWVASRPRKTYGSPVPA